MAIAGRSYANVPVIIRGSLQDPPVLTTSAPVVVSAQPDRRLFKGTVLILAAPQPQAAPSVTVIGSWSGTYATPSGYGTFPPAAPSLQVPVANTGLNGNWLVAFCSWRTPPNVQTTVAVGDDSFNSQPGCNVWEPLGAPAGTSPLTGNVATSIWFCANALAAQNVYVSPNGLVTAMTVLVIEVAGLSPWMTLTAIGTGYTAASSPGPSLTAAAPSGSALLLTAAATDNDSLTVTGPGAGWTALTQVTATDGTDHNADCVLTPAYQVTSGSVTSAWSSSASQDTAAVVGGLLVSGIAPVPPSQTWPYVQFLAGFGSGAQTPWDQIGWTDLTARFQKGSGQRGKQYELDAIQAGTFSPMLSNNDGALTPGYSGSPYNPQPHTPARLLATWPPPPSSSARTYSVWRGYIERWPQSITATRYQVSNTTGTDVFALLTTLMRSLPRAEILADGPFAYWPLADAAGAVTAANIAPGNSALLQQVTSKYGNGGATATFGISVPYLAGDPSCTGWQQASAAASGTQGYALYYQDTALPSISGGVTIEGEFALAGAQPTGKTLVLIAVRNSSSGSVLQVQVSAAGILQVGVKDKITGTVTTTSISAAGMLTGIPMQVAVTFGLTSWTLYVDGGAVRTVTGSCNLANTGYWLSYGGIADRLSATGFCNVTITHLAVFGYQVPQARIASHWYSAVTAMTGQDTAGPRIDRLLGDGNAAVPRIMPPGSDLFTGAMDISGQAVSQNVVNVGESDSAWLMVNSAGYLALQDRRGGYNLPVQWVFGELQGLGANEYAYLGDIATDCDPSQAYNDVTLSQLQAPSAFTTTLQSAATLGAISLTVISASGITAGQVLLLDPGTSTAELVTVSAVAGNVLTVNATAYAHSAGATVSVITTTSTGVTIAVANQASIAAYGDQTLQQTSYLTDPNAVTDQAQWIVNTTSTPVNRVSNMTLDPAANPALWPVVLGLETGQVVWVNRRLQGTQLVMAGQFQVMNVAHSPGPRTWQTKVALLPYPGQVLTCDDPSYGLPGQSNRIGW